jgi:hypothetical protein
MKLIDLRTKVNNSNALMKQKRVSDLTYTSDAEYYSEALDLQLLIPVFTNEKGVNTSFADMQEHVVKAMIADHPDFKMMKRESSASKKVSETIQGLDFSGGFDFMALIPIFMSMSEGTGTSFVAEFHYVKHRELRNKPLDDGYAVDVTDEVITVVSSVLDKDIIKSPNLIAKLGSLKKTGPEVIRNGGGGLFDRH